MFRQASLLVENVLPVVGTHTANCEAPEVMITLVAKSAAADCERGAASAVAHNTATTAVTDFENILKVAWY